MNKQNYQIIWLLAIKSSLTEFTLSSTQDKLGLSISPGMVMPLQ
jgi:hypothetical protein